MRTGPFAPIPTRLCGIAFLALLCCPRALDQPAPAELRGTWTASVGSSEILSGTWTAATSPRAPNAASGSWTLLSAAGTVVAEGTWSARKYGGSWRGAWTARVGRGTARSGSWQASVSDSAIKTFAALLESTAKKYAAGRWRSGRYSGNWWLESSAAPPAR